MFPDALYTQLNAGLNHDCRFALSVANSLADYSISDLIPEELSKLAERLKDEESQGIRTTPGEAVDALPFLEFYPNEDQLKATVIRLFFEPV